MKISIIHPHSTAKWAFGIQWDGLRKALQIIGQKHEVQWYLGGDEPEETFEGWIIPWGVGSLPFNYTIKKYTKARKALLCAGHPQDTANFEKFEAIFVESPAVARQIVHPKVILAFGADTDFFKPRKTEKMFDVFFPATYSQWKRQDLLFAATWNLKTLTCGVVQPDGESVYQGFKKDVTHYTIAGLVPSRLIAQLYNLSHVVCITAWHGSERTTLEAMASNVPLVITRDNELACSLTNDEAIKVDPESHAIREGIDESLSKYVNTRNYVLNKYSAERYAEKILEVIEA